MAAHYAQADLLHQGVLLAIGISQAQAFLDGKIGFTPQEVTDSVNEAKTNSSKLNMVSNVLPVVSLVLGILALVGGILLVRRPDESTV